MNNKASRFAIETSIETLHRNCKPYFLPYSKNLIEYGYVNWDNIHKKGLEKNSTTL